jgi:hypothetical protein
LKKKRNVASDLPHHNFPLVPQQLNPRDGHLRRGFAEKQSHLVISILNPQFIESMRERR